MVNSSRELKREAFFVFCDFQHFGNFNENSAKIPAKAWQLLNRGRKIEKNAFFD